jgi:hypothetical protein
MHSRHHLLHAQAQLPDCVLLTNEILLAPLQSLILTARLRKNLHHLW